MMEIIPRDGFRAGVLGATSLVGKFLLPKLLEAGVEVVAFSRQKKTPALDGIEWRQLVGERLPISAGEDIPLWVSLLPIWFLAQQLAMLKTAGIKRLVALSSTSRFTKKTSPYVAERALAQRLVAAENEVLHWGKENGVTVILLQTTMIYGQGQDHNVAAIANFIQHYRFFPLLGASEGQRQPVHAQDVAFACHAALMKNLPSQTYILSGGEVLTYREMVMQIFIALGKPVRFIKIPLCLFEIGSWGFRCCGKKIPLGVAERMNQHLVFDHAAASCDLDFSPRLFVPDLKQPSEGMSGS